MFKASRDFVVLSLDGSRAVKDQLENNQHATATSILDHYMHRPDSPQFNMSLLEFTRQYSMPKTLGSEPIHRSKRIVVIPHPYCSPDPSGPDYEQYCHQSLMQHKCFRQLDDLLAGHDTYMEAYAAFLQSGHVPRCLEDDIYRLQQLADQEPEQCDTEVCLSFHLCVIYLQACMYNYFIGTRK